MDPRHAEPLPGVLLLWLHVRLQPRASLPSHGPRLPVLHAGRGVRRAHMQDQDDEVSNCASPSQMNFSRNSNFQCYCIIFISHLRLVNKISA